MPSNISQDLFLCYRPCVSPSAVTLSCSAYLDGLLEPTSLVLGKGNQLEIYQYGNDVDGNSKLGLRAVFPLSGSLVGLSAATVMSEGSTQAIDLLLLVFSPAKVIRVNIKLLSFWYIC